MEIGQLVLEKYHFELLQKQIKKKEKKKLPALFGYIFKVIYAKYDYSA